MRWQKMEKYITPQLTRNFPWSTDSSAAAWSRCFTQPSPANPLSLEHCFLVPRTPTLPFVRPRGMATADNGSILWDRKTTHTLKWQLSVQHPLWQLNECQPCLRLCLSHNFRFILNCTLATHTTLWNVTFFCLQFRTLFLTPSSWCLIDLPGSCVCLTNGSFPSSGVMQRAGSQLGAPWKRKSSRHTCILSAPSAQISTVLKNVIKPSPKRKAVPEIGLGHREDVFWERKILQKKKRHNFHKESTGKLRTWKQVQENHWHLLSSLLWVSRKEQIWIWCQKSVRKLQTSRGGAAAEMHDWERHSGEE